MPKIKAKDLVPGNNIAYRYMGIPLSLEVVKTEDFGGAVRVEVIGGPKFLTLDRHQYIEILEDELPDPKPVDQYPKAQTFRGKSIS